MQIALLMTGRHTKVEFETAEFLYCQTQMSASNINTLLDLWAATLLKHGNTPLFANHSDLYSAIDFTPLGDVPWQNFSLKYGGELPDDGDPIPEWMTSEYEVWFRDPRIIIQNMVGNPDYDKSVDTAPVQVFNGNGTCEYQNLMSGDWAWDKVVCFSCDKHILALTDHFSRKKLPKTPKLMVLCSFRSFSEAIKLLFPSRLDTTNTTLSMHQLGLFTTMSAEHTVVLLL